MKGLLIDKLLIESILAGTLTSIIRSNPTSWLHRTIALIESETGIVRGSCTIVAVHGPISAEDIARHVQRPMYSVERLAEASEGQACLYAWRIAEVTELGPPLARQAWPTNASAIWTDVPPGISQRIKAALALTKDALQ
jgi:hypothetical protein